MLESIILGIIQGITEFFPISSTAHLVLLPWFMGWQGDVSTLSFDIALHAGTFTSLLICFWRDLVDMLRKDRRLLALLLLGTIPAGFAGVMLKDYVEGVLRGPLLIAFALVAFSGVMYWAERFQKKKTMRSMGVMDAIFIGAAQAVALVPGVSRSGITISAGLMMGMKRHEALRFSFFLSMPVIGGATLLEAVDLFKAPAQYDLKLFAVGFVSATIVGVLAIKFMLRYLKTNTMNVFVIYRIALAGVIFGWLWLGE